MTTTPAPRPLVLRARRAPRSRAGVREISQAAATDELLASLDEALAIHDDRAAGTLALAIAALDADVGTERLVAIAPDLEETRELVSLLRSAKGDRLALVERLLELEILSEDREAALVAIAVHRLGWTDPPSDAWRIRMRRLARRKPTHETDRVLLGAAIAASGVKPAIDIGTELVEEAEKDPETLAEVIGWLEKPVLETLPDAEEARVVATVTVRHAESKVGRNDPCPCGSGKKFKKCHGEAGAEPGAGPAAQEPSVDPAGLVASDVKYLRLAQIAALELGKMRSDSLEEAFRRALDFRRWDLAERIAAEIDSRTGKPVAAAAKPKKAPPKKAAADADPPPTARTDLVLSAVDARRWDVVERLLAGAKDEKDVPDAVRVQRASAGAALGPLEEVARTSLDDIGPLTLDLAFALLDHWPALGVLVARGIAPIVPDRDASAVLAEIERARDVLDLPYGDLAVDVVDGLEDNREAWAMVEKTDARMKAQREELAQKTARATEELGHKAAELTSTVLRLRDVEEELARHVAEARARSGPEKSAGLADEERKRLGARIDELKALVTEGNKERAELRAEITALSTSAQPVPKDERTRKDDDDDPGTDADASALRGVLVPVFAKAAIASLDAHPTRVRKMAIEAAAGLAVGDPIAWRGCKQMEGVEKVWSARLGIHNRLLFRLHDGELEVLDVVTREDLLKTLERWR